MLGLLTVSLLRASSAGGRRRATLTMTLWAILVDVVATLLHRRLLHVRGVDFAKALGHSSGIFVLLGHHVLILVGHIRRIRKSWNGPFNSVWYAAARRVLRARAVLRKLGNVQNSTQCEQIHHHIRKQQQVGTIRT